MTAISSYKDLRVWQASRALVSDIYQICQQLPKYEQFALCSQMQRAAVSIPSNIAEGYRRNNTGEYIHFLSIAAGSAAELETQLILTTDIHSIATLSEQENLDHIQKMLTALINKLKAGR